MIFCFALCWVGVPSIGRSSTLSHSGHGRLWPNPLWPALWPTLAKPTLADVTVTKPTLDNFRVLAKFSEPKKPKPQRPKTHNQTLTPNPGEGPAGPLPSGPHTLHQTTRRRTPPPPDPPPRRTEVDFGQFDFGQLAQIVDFRVVICVFCVFVCVFVVWGGVWFVLVWCGKPPQLHTTTREVQTCTFQGTGASNTSKIPREDPEREEKRILRREREKKSEILGLPPLGFGAPNVGNTLFLGLGLQVAGQKKQTRGTKKTKCVCVCVGCVCVCWCVCVLVCG